MVTVHRKVAVAFHGQVESAVLREQRQHVVEKSDARIDLAFAFTVKIHGNADGSFRCFPLFLRLSHLTSSLP